MKEKKCEGMKKIIQFFEKIGMFRSGWGAGTYKNAKEAPDQVVFDGTTYKSPKQIKKEHQEKNSKEKCDSSGCCLSGGALFWVFVVIGAILLLMFVAGSGFSLWFIVAVVVWFFFLRHLKKQKALKTGRAVLWGAATIVLTLILLGFSSPVDDNKTGSSGGASSKELAQLDGKVLKVSSEDGTVTGQIGLKKGTGDFVQVFYHLFVQEDLAVNKVCFTCEENSEWSHDCRSWDKYNYAGRVMGSAMFDDERNISYNMMPIFCGEKPTIADPTAFNSKGMGLGCFDAQIGKDLTTNLFYFGTMTSVDSLQDVLDADELVLFDGEDYVIRDSCVDGEVGSSLEDLRSTEAAKNEPPMKTYKLVFEE